MERRQFDHVVDQLKNLTKRQREKLVAMLTEGFKRDRTEELIEQAVRQRLKCQFREWLARFHGVATRYLPNYLGWRWALDGQRINSTDALLRTAIGVFHT
jgi:hypothetical protein